MQCPCGSERPYSQCCEPLHRGQAANSAEALMRSRYSAYVLGLADYLLASWHASTRPAEITLSPDTKWLGLNIKSYRPLNDSQAEVEFVARYRDGNKGAVRLQETSRFQQENGHWFYLDGEHQ